MYTLKKNICIVKKFFDAFSSVFTQRAPFPLPIHSAQRIDTRFSSRFIANRKIIRVTKLKLNKIAPYFYPLSLSC